MNLSFFKEKRVLITGHTGFKGSWLTKILLDAGAEVCGYALEPPTTPSLFETLHLKEQLKENHIVGDIRDLEKLKKTFERFAPGFVIHMAAQPIVRTSYEEPVYTYDTNVMGTVNVLECVRLSKGIRSFLNVTTDKVYENMEDDIAYKETDRLDGFDPYSNSKSCSELVTHSYKKSFLDAAGIPVSTARAGNVIGGGDYAKDRLIPDCVRAVSEKKPIVIRNPKSVRPFQHVLEPLSIYLSIIEAQAKDFAKAGYYNVGPDKKDCLSAGEIAELFCTFYQENATWEDHSDGGPHEAKLLMLSNEKIKSVFSWKPVWDAKEAVRRCVEWEKAEDKIKITEKQIKDFLQKESENV